jgi:CheY-like chemotaxis protein
MNDVEDDMTTQPVPVVGPTKERPRVVVVNDEPAVLALYRDMLEEIDFEPVTMVTEAIETDRIRAAEPDAVILDLQVGEQARYGVAMAQELRSDESFAAIPIVVCTANAAALDGERRTLQAIGVPILLKPFTIEELEGALGIG